MNKQEESYALGLSKLIRFKTITDNSEEEFKKLHNELKTMFPNVFKVGKLFEFEKGIYVVVKGSSKEQPILFMNHHDVVEASGEWEKDPFSGEIKDGVVYGRGTIDTKGGFYCMFQAMEELLEKGFTPKQDIYLLSTMDEEDEGTGAQEIAKHFLKNNIKFRYILDEGGLVVDNPLGGDGKFAMIATGEKAMFEIKVHANDKGGHSSAPGKDTALVRLSKFVLEVENSKAFTKVMSPTVAKSFECFSLKTSGAKKFIFKHAKLFAPILKLIAPSIPVLNAMFRTTIAFTMMKGSDQVNVIPASAYVVLNVRVAPHQTSDVVLAILGKYAKKHNLTYELITKPVDNDVSTHNNQDYENIVNATKEQFGDVVVCPYVSNTASDSRFLRKCANNVYGFVPFEVNEQQLESIHGNNENVDIVNLPKAINFYKELMEK